MQVFVIEQWSYLLYSLLSGLVFGVLYDLLCSLPYTLKKSKKFSFIGDLFFIFLIAFLTAAVSYSANGGIFRLYAILSSFSVFVIYKLSIGKLVLQFYLYTFNKIEALLSYLFNKFKIVLDFSVKFVKIKIVRIRIKLYKRKLISRIKDSISGKELYGNKTK